MNHTIIFAANDFVELAKSTGETFGFNTSLFVSQAISFCVIAFLLQKFAYKPILQVLEERRKTIAQGLANAEKIKQELARAEEEHKRIMNEAAAQAGKLIEEARTAAAKVLEVETQKAVAAAGEIIAKARQASEAELARMKTELRREVGRLVVETTAKVTGKILTLEDQQRLAEETNKQLAA
jgi:F-type H+-transporting ATPase subunit b